MLRNLVSFALAVCLLVILATAVRADSEAMCVSINGNEVCASPHDLVKLLTAIDNSQQPTIVIESPVVTQRAQVHSITTNVPEAVQPVHSGDNFSVSGGVETATNLEVAQGQFINTIGLGTQSFLAEPGKMSRYCSNDEFENEIPDYQGAVTCWGETNHGVFTHVAPAYTPLVEGGFKMFTANRGTIEVPDRVTIHFEGDSTTSWLVVLRGRYADFNTPNDLNVNLEVTDYVPGNIEWIEYSGNPNGGFVSEEHFLQIADGAMRGNNNCGREGCPEQYVLMFDYNTGGWTVITRTWVVASNGDITLSPWTLVASNMDYLQ